MRQISVLLAASMLGIAAPAAANITIFATPGAVQPDETVQFQAGNPVGSTAFGITNQTDTGVTFQGTENLATPSNGQARIEASDGGLDALTFFLTNSSLGFTEVEFNIFGTGRTADNVTLNFTDQFGTVFANTFALNNGQNFFSAVATDNQVIKSVSLFLDGNVSDVRQFRIGGIGEFGVAVPEPETWSLLIAGFALVGTAARRRRMTSVTG